MNMRLEDRKRQTTFYLCGLKMEGRRSDSGGGWFMSDQSRFYLHLSLTVVISTADKCLQWKWSNFISMTCPLVSTEMNVLIMSSRACDARGDFHPRRHVVSTSGWAFSPQSRWNRNRHQVEYASVPPKVFPGQQRHVPPASPGQCPDQMPKPAQTGSSPQEEEQRLHSELSCPWGWAQAASGGNTPPPGSAHCTNTGACVYYVMTWNIFKPSPSTWL